MRKHIKHLFAKDSYHVGNFLFYQPPGTLGNDVNNNKESPAHWCKGRGVRCIKAPGEKEAAVRI